MGDVALVVVLVAAASAAVFYLGMHYGAAFEHKAVAGVLAEYQKLSSEATTAVTAILLSLRGDYAREYLRIKRAI